MVVVDLGLRGHRSKSEKQMVTCAIQHGYMCDISLSGGPVLRHLNESSITSTEINL